ncbi:superoxide dismutase [Flavobacterium weaverense]|uniref:Superoxide dismutase n=1 Tax=Flavobacterium weaverense TaxID=271156 RepID=A0A3M0A0J8_9FLAO|nr:superoxide dismutase [Flavobacterium weaverense]RMA78280.1 Fe-Mn family superoxide dismutase [Flavobacterium weaverense]
MMKKTYLLIPILLLIILLQACNDKKLIEVVEVPLPTTVEEKPVMGSPDDVRAIEGSFQMEKLPYTYDALAPSISATTLEMHYSKHYLTYTNNLNKAVLGTPLENLTIEEVLAKLDPNDQAIRNNAGGFYNHSMYWKCMRPDSAREASGSLAEAIIRDFGSFGRFTTMFKNEATKHFGSGWVWLIIDRSGKLQVSSTDNQDNPLMRNATMPGTPILALDIWEHSYYLDYQYRRANYIDAFFTLINWKKVQENYESAVKK